MKALAAIHILDFDDPFWVTADWLDRMNARYRPSQMNQLSITRAIVFLSSIAENIEQPAPSVVA